MNLPRIILPWTKTSELSANSRLHWRRKAPLIKAQKATAHALALEAGWHRISIPDGAIIEVVLTYCPPSGTVYPDDDNVVTAHKGARDALAAVIGVDDRRFRARAIPGERCKSGAVIVDARIVSQAASSTPFRSIGDLAAQAVDRTIVNRRAAE